VKILVTGGAGFIGSAFIRFSLREDLPVETLVNLDLLTYASNLDSLKECASDPRYVFVAGNILNAPLIEEICRTHHIDTIVHFAAESHVDRSIDDPLLFYRTNALGTLTLLEVVRRFPHIHFHHVSTDEVYGSLLEGEAIETSPYFPSSPYAASKAASDHFVHAYLRTYHISATLSHCSNNYGPFQHEEKFIPRMIRCCMAKKPLPLYGNGQNIRDWIFVDDHTRALWLILRERKSGERYNISAGALLKNIDVAKGIAEKFRSSSSIAFVADRPGHDFRYALSAEKLRKQLGWEPQYSFTEGLDLTIGWFQQCEGLIAR
jgi:dTDP-glucose 4,6-dehydratase